MQADELPGWFTADHDDYPLYCLTEWARTLPCQNAAPRIFWRSACLWSGGLEWRNFFRPLIELRATI